MIFDEKDLPLLKNHSHLKIMILGEGSRHNQTAQRLIIFLWGGCFRFSEVFSPRALVRSGGGPFGWYFTSDPSKSSIYESTIRPGDVIVLGRSRYWFSRGCLPYVWWGINTVDCFGPNDQWVYITFLIQHQARKKSGSTLLFLFLAEWEGATLMLKILLIPPCSDVRSRGGFSPNCLFDHMSVYDQCI